ncbi:MAG: hypothetical protein EOO28_13830 [Comamonadaceae bacterium]|nr:MAG: hypothetical protein EOO28_13830 [Comamonadaceae bacterium]
MPHQAVVPRLRPEEFGLFATALHADEGFPKTFGSWLDRTVFGAPGRQGCLVEIAFEEFMSYCSSSRAQPDVAALHALASSKVLG